MARLPAIDAATALIARDYPDCLAAFLGGSVVRGEDTATSDLDIMVIVPENHRSYRRSFQESGWPVEVFVQTPAVHRYFSRHDAERRMPSSSRIVCEGIVVWERDGWASRLKEEACALLEAGPAPLTDREMAFARYGVSDLIDDLVDARPEELPFIAMELASSSANLILDCQRQWRGRGKWLVRSLRAYDPTLADQLVAAVPRATRGDTAALLDFANAALDMAGGRLWDGFRAEAPELAT